MLEGFGRRTVGLSITTTDSGTIANTTTGTTTTTNTAITSSRLYGSVSVAAIVADRGRSGRLQLVAPL